MIAPRQIPLPPRIARLELKYMIPSEWIDPIAAFAAVYCAMDRYSEMAEQGFYLVNNLYLDSPNYYFLRQRMENAPDRFNMRIRTYGETADQECFLEIKRKTGDMIRKYRAFISDCRWLDNGPASGTPGSPPFCPEPAEVENRDLFERLVRTYDAAPKIFSRYRRQAWVSLVDDYARITFDTDLRCMPQSTYRLTPCGGEMTPCDAETVFDPACSVILELKCLAARVPLWMIDLVKYFQLQRTGFSKYMTGMQAVLDQCRYNFSYRKAVIQ